MDKKSVLLPPPKGGACKAERKDIMNIVIIGCGMVGSELAAELDRSGHDISVIDREESSFEALPADFSGFTTIGVPIDTEVLRRAGIESCDAFCAVTGDDNMNIMAAEVASKIFGVKRVFARIRDISKGEIFESLGIHTVCPTTLVVNAARQALEEEPTAVSKIRLEDHTVKFVATDVPDELIGGAPEDIIYEPGEILFAVVRKGRLIFFTRRNNIIFEENDRLIFVKEP